MFGFGGVCSKSFSALFYKPGLLWRTNTILGRYQGLSIATLNDLNTYSCKAGIYSKTDVSSSVYTRQSAKKISKKQLFHTTRAAASSGISLLDWWSPVTLTYGSLIAAGG